MPTTDDYAAEILREVGDPKGTLAPLLASPTFILWTLWNEKGIKSIPLQALYTKRSALDIRLAEEYDRSDFQAGRREIQDRQSQRWDHLQQMRLDTQALIDQLERSVRTGVTGTLTTLAPVVNPLSGGVAAEQPVYAGSPYYRLRNRI